MMFVYDTAHVSNLFLLLNTVPLDGYTTLYLSIRQVMDIWIVSSLGYWELRRCKHLCTSICCAHVFISLGCIHGSRIARSCESFMFNFLKCCQIVLAKLVQLSQEIVRARDSCTILQFHQQCIKFSFLHILFNICYYLSYLLLPC